ncbi:pirin family protein [Marinomonas sp. 2405UD68-3]|uniref:pirin family protein n=1 Tax=Marinomonas sp. 2405UD68-3 TaxID=3391835 RepID=UPI0039C8F3B0
MNILSRDTLALGGFAGIVEHRLVTDSRVFGNRKKPETFEGFGNMVYLADAKYKPHGTSGMHSHSEIDVISIIVEGRVSHEGSMEHGKDLIAGDVQVQRAGGDGFSHDEINPDGAENRMLQVWVLPEEKGQSASYKAYVLQQKGRTRIYGGNKFQQATFDSHTLIDIVNLKKGEKIDLDREGLIYIVTGAALVSEPTEAYERDATRVQEGDLILSQTLQLTGQSDLQLLIVSKAT